MLRWVGLAVVIVLWLAQGAGAQGIDERFPLYRYLTADEHSAMICYTPSQLDPRNPANQRALLTSSIRADLEALRPAFDGLVLYGYHEACTPRIVAVAKDLKYRAVLLAIWDPKSVDEIDGVAELARLDHGDMALGVIVGNEGITFKRYELEDLTIAADRLRRKIPKTVPLTTSEPLVGYGHAEIRQFGDFLAPNIHPVFDREQLPAAEAAAWAREQALKLARETGKPALLKETGFPHAGKPMYSPQSQADFWSAYTKAPRREMVPGNKQAWAYFGIGFEAYDLPWKSEESRLEIEKSWGLLSPERRPYPAFDVWKRLAN